MKEYYILYDPVAKKWGQKVGLGTNFRKVPRITYATRYTKEEAELSIQRVSNAAFKNFRVVQVVDEHQVETPTRKIDTEALKSES